MDPALLVIVRHAESERNAAKRGRVFFEDDAAAAPFRDCLDRDTALTTAGCVAWGCALDYTSARASGRRALP